MQAGDGPDIPRFFSFLNERERSDLDSIPFRRSCSPGVIIHSSRPPSVSLMPALDVASGSCRILLEAFTAAMVPIGAGPSSSSSLLDSG